MYSPCGDVPCVIASFRSAASNCPSQRSMFWLSLPPFTLRNVAVPAALAVLGAALELWGLTRGERKLGIWAILVSLLAVGGALWFQSEELGELESVFGIGLLAATLRFAERRAVRLSKQSFEAAGSQAELGNQ